MLRKYKGSRKAASDRASQSPSPSDAGADTDKQAPKKKLSRAEIESRRVRGPADVTVFGDSHSILFLPFAHYYGRLDIPVPPKYTIAGRAIFASSIAGLRPHRSTLNAKEQIVAALPEIERLVLAFGQVDLELGYYHRRVVKGEQHTPSSYVAWLVDIYAGFVDGLVLEGRDLALKGVNLTSLVPHDFAVQYVQRIVRKDDQRSNAEMEAKFAPFMLDEDQQNAMHLAFNAGLKDYAERRSHKYFDLVAATADPCSLPTAPHLAHQYRNAQPDHHLADTVAVRRMHYDSVGAVFGLDGDRISSYFKPAKRV